LQEGFGDQEFMGKIVINTKPNRKAWGNNKGQNLVEFALVVPLLLLLVIGIAEFGRAWMTKNIMTGAAREAVRLLAVPPPYGGPAVANSRAVAVLASAGITTATVSVVDTPGTYGPVTVTVSYNFPTAIIGFFPGLDNISLSSTTTMRREYDAP
jgi:Flp pilus assembly protein TadG